MHVCYLLEYLISEFKRLGIDYLLSDDLIRKTIQKCLWAEILHLSHKETDALLIMNYSEITRRNQFNQCIVYSPGTLIPK